MVFMVYIHLLLKHKKDKNTLDRLLGSNLELCHRSSIYSINKWNTVLEKIKIWKDPLPVSARRLSRCCSSPATASTSGSREAVETATD